MSIDSTVLAIIASPIIALFVGALLNRALENRPRVVSYLGHVSGIELKNGDQPLQVNTHSIVLQNAGRKTANNVRIGHNMLPDFQVFPDIEYSVSDLPGGGKEILFPKLVPKKQITITYLYFPPQIWDQVNTHLESDEGPLKVINVLPMIQLPQWLNIVISLLIVYGAIGVLYTVYEIVKWIIH